VVDTAQVEERMEISKAKERAENLVLKLRELVGVLRQFAPTPEREARKEQLKVVGNSIQHLESKGVAVPEDLRKLKNKLEAEIQGAEKNQVVLYFLRDELSQVLAEIGNTVRKGSTNGTGQKQA